MARTKRKAERLVDEAEKRTRIEPPSRKAAPIEESDEEDLFHVEEPGDDLIVEQSQPQPPTQTQLESSASPDEQLERTPSTSMSPAPSRSQARAKFPSELKTIKCDLCDKTFNRPARLISHMRSHTNERPFKCDYAGCDESYREKKHLTQHIKGAHTNERTYECDWEGCDKSFLTATRLRRHITAHEGQDLYRCTDYPPCNQSFRKRETLNRHQRSDHLGLTPYPCTIFDPATNAVCQAGFDGAGGLKKHMEKVHGNNPQYYCSECLVPGEFHPDGSAIHLGFPSQAKLDAHTKKEHSHCQFCHRKFASYQDLRAHVDSQHSGKSLEERRVHKCTFPGCPKTFTKQWNLTVHYRTCHNGERFICGTFDVSHNPEFADFQNNIDCDEEFYSKANLEDHIRTAHLLLPSKINANRKTNSLSCDGQNEGLEPPRVTKKYKKQKEDMMVDLTGYDPRRKIACRVLSCKHMFIRVYDLQVHLRSKHKWSDRDVEEVGQDDEHAFGAHPQCDGNSLAGMADGGAAAMGTGFSLMGAGQISADDSEHTPLGFGGETEMDLPLPDPLPLQPYPTFDVAGWELQQQDMQSAQPEEAQYVASAEGLNLFSFEASYASMDAGVPSGSAFAEAQQY